MSDYFLGEIRMFSFDYAPKNLALCQGQVMNIQQNSALYALLGVQFGGDARTTFKLPDLQGRVPLCTGRSPSGTYYQQGVGSADGSEAVTLATNQMPAHTHTVSAMSAQGSVPQPADAIVSSVKPSSATPPVTPSIYGPYNVNPPSPLKALNSGTVSNVGAGVAHPSMQPFIVLNFCISLTGIFPPSD